MAADPGGGCGACLAARSDESACRTRGAPSPRDGGGGCGGGGGGGCCGCGGGSGGGSGSSGGGGGHSGRAEGELGELQPDKSSTCSRANSLLSCCCLLTAIDEARTILVLACSSASACALAAAAAASLSATAFAFAAAASFAFASSSLPDIASSSLT